MSKKQHRGSGRAQWKKNGKNSAEVDGLPVLRVGREGAWLGQLAAHFSYGRSRRILSICACKSAGHFSLCPQPPHPMIDFASHASPQEAVMSSH